MSNVISIAKAFNLPPSAPSPDNDAAEKEWQGPTPLPTRLLNVEEFNIDMLPTRLAPFVADISDRLAIPPDFAGVASMVAAGAMIGSKLSIRPQAFTPWSEVFNLFGVMVGSPSVLKTPALSEVLNPIRKMEARLIREYDNELAHHEIEMRAFKISADVAEKKARTFFAKGMADEGNTLLAEAPPTPPRQPRLLVNNTTVEKLGTIMQDNGNGILVVCDEIVTLLNELSHPEKEMARGFMLTGWGGAESYSFDRITRGTTRIDRVTLSLLGTTQPEVFAGYLRDSLLKRNDGLAQRLQLLTIPDLPPDWRNVDRLPDNAARAEAYACYDELRQLIPEAVGATRDIHDDGCIPFLRFDPDALAMFTDWRGGLEAKIRDDDLMPALRDHFGKYRGLAARLAGICHLASGETGPVTARAVEQALQWIVYLESHARRAYASVSLDTNSAARSILRKIDKGQLTDQFTEKSVYSAGWSGLGKGPRLTEALKTLCDYDWLEAEDKKTGGRPKTIYHINPLGLERLRSLH